MRRTVLVLLLLPTVFLALASLDVSFAGTATEDATESAPADPVNELLGDESERPSVLVILAGLAAAGGVIALAIGRERQRKRLDDDHGPT